MDRLNLSQLGERLKTGGAQIGRLVSDKMKEILQTPTPESKMVDETTIYEYRHVVLPPDVAKLLPKNRLLSENEWRAIGVQQSRGWVHYAVHRPEPHIMLFRRTLNYQENQAQQNILLSD